MGIPSLPARAPAAATSPLDHQGGLSLWLRGAIFSLALLAAARPDRWGWSLPSLHSVFLSLFVYSILGDFAVGLLAILAPIAICFAVTGLLCFDRVIYVPTYRLARNRFRLSAWAAFGLAVLIEGFAAGNLIMAYRHHVHAPESAPTIVVHPSRIKKVSVRRRFH
jgi:hypothetical protein